MGTNSVSIAPFGTGMSVGGAGNTCSAQIGITATVSGTWVPDPQLSSDPAPPVAIVFETGDATAYTTNPDGTVSAGTVSDGLGDPADASGHAVTPANVVPFPHMTRASNGSFSFQRTFSDSASGTASAPFTDDTATGQTNVTIPGPDSGPLTITRQVSFLDLNDYQYTVTKSGYQANKTLPNN